jgi:hypothetical protein
MERMSNRDISYCKFTCIEKDALSACLESIRAILKHAGEKGRALEHELASLIRVFLPNKYDLSTDPVHLLDIGSHDEVY